MVKELPTMVKIIERGSEKEYQCEGCGKIFYNYGTTNNHEKWECSELGKTQNEREKNRQEDYWICDGCSKEFKTKFETIEHEKNCRQYLEAVKSDTSDGIKIQVVPDNWVMIRPSGTEPIIRIYGESNSQQNLDSLISNFVAKTKSILS